jgi:aquaporin Z
VANSVSNGTITHPGVALVWGLVVLAIVYAFGDISGAHVNPAVTFGFWASGRFPLRQVGPYISSQIAGAILASIVLRFLFPTDTTALGSTVPSDTAMQSFILETILTWFLMLVVLCVATGAKEKGIMAGVAVGSVVGLEAMFAGPICGASMNPARSIGPALVSGTSTHQWIYVVAPLLGSALAVATFTAIQERQPLTRADEATRAPELVQPPAP